MAKIDVYGIMKWSGCRKAVAFLEEQGLDFEFHDIKSDKPSLDLLKRAYKQSGLDLGKFFNTSGILYRELNVKEKRAQLSEEEQLELLASEGMLVKRPFLISDTAVLLGFKEDAYKEAFGH